MAPTEFHEALGALGIAQQRVARLFDVSPRAVRRWQHGERRVPCGVDIVVRLLAAGAVTIEQVERAAVHRANGGAEAPISQPIAVTADAGCPKKLVLKTTPISEPADGWTRGVPLEPETDGIGAIPVEDDLHELPADAVTSAPLLLEPTSETFTNLVESALEPSAILADPVIVELSLAEKVAALTSRVCHWPYGDPQHSDFHFCGSPVTALPYCEVHRAQAYLATPPPRLVRRRRRLRPLYTSARIAWAG
jgi:GcrA cell cycle regulator